jgi:flagellar protein FliS
VDTTALLGRFRAEAVATAPPAKLLTMLYDRLVLDLDRAAAALDAGRPTEAHSQLTHAQAIVHELRASLDVGAWTGADGLASLYGYVLTELVGANVARDAARVRACRDLVVPLRDAWHQAAASVATPGARAAASPGGLGLLQPLGVLGVG